jgi:serine/threonine protein kinase
MTDPTRTQPAADPDATASAGDRTADLDATASADGSTADRTTPPDGPSPAPSAPPGFDLLGEIGRGGMGVVYRARDLELDREVAVKVLLPRYGVGSTTARRFVGEAHVTAQLQHPGVPPVYRVGELPDGRPFLAMKLIKGDTLDALLKAGGPGSARWLGTFEGVCQAVGYAHAHGVIHRDLKPANVMVGAFGEVQVMDWGLAKVLVSGAPHEPRTSSRAGFDRAGPSGAGTATRTAEPRTPDAAPLDGDPTRVTPPRDADPWTQYGSVLGTPAFMAPEQASGDLARVDRRTDVFGLGAVLCALLTGRPPFVGDTAENTRQKAARADLADAFARLEPCGAEPDLVALCKRCLSADPADRPADATEVATAVAALRAAADDRARQAEIDREKAEVESREQRKRRRVVQRAGGAIAAVLLAGLGTSLWLLNRATAAEGQARANETQMRDERDAKADALQTAERNLGYSRESNKILGSVFESLDPKASYETIADLRAALTKNLRKAVSDLDEAAVGDPRVVAELQHTLGVSLLALGEAELATAVLQKCRDTRTAVLEPDDPDTINAINNLAVGHQYAGRFDRALPLFEDALRRCERRYGADHTQTVRQQAAVAQCYHQAGQIDRAVPLYEEVYPKLKAALGPDDADTLTGLGNLAAGYFSQGKYDRAVPRFEEAYRRSEAALGANHPDTLRNLSNLAAGYEAVGRTPEALPLYEKALERKKARLGADHPDTLLAVTGLANGYRSTGRIDRAVQLYEEALAGTLARQGPGHPDTLACQASLAAGYWSQKRLDKSVPLYEQAHAGYVRRFGRGHTEALHAAANLGVNYRDAGRLDEAVPLLTEAFAQVKKYPFLWFAGPSLLETYRRAGRSADAADLAPAVVDAARTTLPKGSPRLATQLTNCGRALAEAGRFAPAEELYREALAVRQKHEPDAWTTFDTMSTLGGALLGQQKYADAEPMLAQGYEGMKAREKTIPPTGATRIPESLDRLIALYTVTNKPHEVAKYRGLRAKYRETLPPPRKG